MKVRFALSGALLGLMFVTVSAQAEIYQCDGKWTNLPCDGSIGKTLPESSSVQIGEPDEAGAEEEKSPAESESNEQSAALEPLAPRYSIVRKLKKASRDFYLKHKISLTKEELHNFEERCMKRETPIVDCNNQYDGFIVRLNSQVKKP